MKTLSMSLKVFLWRLQVSERRRLYLGLAALGSVCVSAYTNSDGVQRQGNDFCSQILGVDERAFQAMSLAQRRQLCTRVTQDRGISFGQFQTYTLQDLRNRIDRMPLMSTAHRFNVIIDPTIDVKALQADPQNRDAVFQVASNFNCLEAGDYVGSGNGVQGWQSIRAQGEAASMSAFPGVVLKKYLHQGPINLLDELVRQNVVGMDAHGIRVTSLSTLQNLLDHRDDIRVGYHGDVSVTHGANFANITAQNQRINQVFVAALNVNSPIRVGQNHHLSVLRADVRSNIVRTFLRAAYEGTLRSAFLHGKNRVFLTLVCRMDQNRLTLEQQAFFNRLQRFVSAPGG